MSRYISRRRRAKRRRDCRHHGRAVDLGLDRNTRKTGDAPPMRGFLVSRRRVPRRYSPEAPLLTHLTQHAVRPDRRRRQLWR